MSDPRTLAHEVIDRSGTIANADDIEFAWSLVRDAVAANLPTAEPGPPPTGADVERRRRFP